MSKQNAHWRPGSKKGKDRFHYAFHLANLLTHKFHWLSTAAAKSLTGKQIFMAHAAAATSCSLLKRINSAVQLIRGIIMPLSRLPILKKTPQDPLRPRPSTTRTNIGNFLFAQLIRFEIATSCLTSLMANSTQMGGLEKHPLLHPFRTLAPQPAGDY